MTPPIVQAEMLAGSGPSLRPCFASARLTRPAIVPGSTRTRRPSSSTETPRQWRATSTSTPSLCACPDRLVPAARNVIGTPLRRAWAMRPRTSSTPSASTTAFGSIR